MTAGARLPLRLVIGLAVAIALDMEDDFAHLLEEVTALQIRLEHAA